MSFSGDVKSEICRVAETKEDCCKIAECYGALIMGKSFSARSIKFSTEYELVARHVCDLLEECIGEKLCEVKKNKSKYQFEITKRRDVEDVLYFFGHEPNQLNLRINRDNMMMDCCYPAFMRGVFLACGTVTDPERNYHLEYIVPYMKLSQDLHQLITESNIQAKSVVRKGSYVIYIKDSENIEDMLTYIGAQISSLEIMSVKVEKDVRNRVNRKINFECANIERSIQAGLKQSEAIELIIERQGFDTLPEEYKELAQLRLENPDMSLKQLGEELSTPLSRSGIKHRLDKMIEMAENLKK